MAPVANPRAMLAFHVTLWLAGAVSCAAAAAWGHLRLSDGGRNWTERGLIAGLWIGLGINVLNAFVGLKTEFAGGATGPAWAQSAVQVLQLGITVTLVPALATMAIGLGRSVSSESPH